MKRMGGGFGGKETRSCFSAAAAAVGARRLQRPVKLTLDRDYDMSTTGQRRAFMVKYTAAATWDAETKTPALACLDAQLFSNGGCSLDLSVPVLDRAMLHIDNCYKWPALRARGVVCKTNQPPHTAFRGFGGPQGLMAGEHAMEQLASALKKRFGWMADAAVPSVTAAAEALRALSFYRDGVDRTHFGTLIKEGSFHVPRAWAELESTARVAERRAECAAFNAENRWRKRGLAMLPTKFGINFTAKFMNQGGALVHIYTDGSVLVSHGGTEMGQGLHTKVQQVTAHAMGIPLERVNVGSTDTDKVSQFTFLCIPYRSLLFIAQRLASLLFVFSSLCIFWILNFVSAGSKFISICGVTEHRPLRNGCAGCLSDASRPSGSGARGTGKCSQARGRHCDSRAGSQCGVFSEGGSVGSRILEGSRGLLWL